MKWSYYNRQVDQKTNKKAPFWSSDIGKHVTKSESTKSKMK